MFLLTPRINTTFTVNLNEGGKGRRRAGHVGSGGGGDFHCRGRRALAFVLPSSSSALEPLCSGDSGGGGLDVFI